MFSLEKTISCSYPLPELNNPFIPHLIIEDEDMVSNFTVSSLDPPFYCNYFEQITNNEMLGSVIINRYQYGSRVFYEF